MSDVAFLVFEPLRQRRKDNSFDGNDNVGAQVIADALIRGGIGVDYVTPETADTAKVVLVSLTSTYDVYALLGAVQHLSIWQPKRRLFKVLAGVFGLQNPTPLREYIDYAAFGRVHLSVTMMVHAILRGESPVSENVIDCRRPTRVTFAQDPLYRHDISGFKEEFTGCPLKCKFCHYTYARKHQGSDVAYAKGQYVQTTLTGGGTPEVTWDQLLTWDKKAGRIRVAIDGLSQRLRYMYGKRISNQDIIDGINKLGSYGPNATTLLVYNIVNFPGEHALDYAEFVDTVRRADPKYRVIVVLHSTPFRPSLATPMQWEQVNILPNWSKRSAQVVVDRPNLRVVHSFTLESSWSHLKSVIVERADPEDDRVISVILNNPKLKAATGDRALRMFEKNFDMSRWLDERDIQSPPPVPYLSSYLQDATIRKIEIKMRKERAGKYALAAAA